MSEILTLKAEMRDKTGKGAARALRRAGMVPATIYGAKNAPMSIAVAEKEITKYYRQPQYISRIIEFEIAKKKYKVLPKAIDLHPLTELVRHADFVFLEKKMQKMEVPLVYVNKEKCTAIVRGGYFNIVKRSIKILCPVGKLPRKIEIDVVATIGEKSIKMEKVSLPEGAELLEDPKFVIASVIGKKGKSDESGNENEYETGSGGPSSAA